MSQECNAAGQRADPLSFSLTLSVTPSILLLLLSLLHLLFLFSSSYLGVPFENRFLRTEQLDRNDRPCCSLQRPWLPRLPSWRERERSRKIRERGNCCRDRRKSQTARDFSREACYRRTRLAIQTISIIRFAYLPTGIRWWR